MKTREECLEADLAFAKSKIEDLEIEELFLKEALSVALDHLREWKLKYERLFARNFPDLTEWLESQTPPEEVPTRRRSTSGSPHHRGSRRKHGNTLLTPPPHQGPDSLDAVLRRHVLELEKSQSTPSEMPTPPVAVKEPGLEGGQT